MSTAQTIRMVKGTDLTIVTTNQDQDGTALDLTGGSALLTVKEDKDDTDANAKISKDGTALDSAGNATFTIAPPDVSTLDAKEYLFNIRVKTSGGKWHETFHGAFILDGVVSTRIT